MIRSTGTYRAMALTLCFALLAPASARGFSHLSTASMDMSSMEAEAMDMSEQNDSEVPIPCPPTGADLEICCQASATVPSVAPGVEAPCGWMPLYLVDAGLSGWSSPAASTVPAPPLPLPAYSETPVHILNASFLL